MEKTWILAGMLSCMALTGWAKESDDEAKEEKKGEAIVTVFSNLHSGFGSDNDDRGFELERAYIGYQYKLNGNLTLKAVADFGQSKDVSDLDRVGYIKNALVTWKYKDLTLNGGLIPTTQFKTQEDFWGKRYIMKSFQDEYKFGSSADLGISAAYRFAGWIAADVIVVNGEGYKKIEAEEGLQYGLGVSLTPAEGWMVRLYGSYDEPTDEEDKGIVNLAAFAGYKGAHFSIGAEYNYMQNADHVDKADRNGISAYATVNFSPDFSLFARWDNVSSKDDWNEANDGHAALIGVEFKLGKYVKLSPNFRYWAPAAGGEKDGYSAYLSASFSL